MVIKKKSQERVYDFRKERHLHHNIGYDIMHYTEESVILFSIKIIYYMEVILSLSLSETI